LKSRTALIRPCSRTASAIWMRGWSDGHGFTASNNYNERGRYLDLDARRSPR
jgi:hypothetical protein